MHMTLLQWVEKRIAKYKLRIRKATSVPELQWLNMRITILQELRTDIESCRIKEVQ